MSVDACVHQIFNYRMTVVPLPEHRWVSESLSWALFHGQHPHIPAWPPPQCNSQAISHAHVSNPQQFQAMVIMS